MQSITQAMCGRGEELVRLSNRFLKDRSGEMMLEYGLMAGLISVAILTTLVGIGKVLDENVFTVIASAASAV